MKKMTLSALVLLALAAQAGAATCPQDFTGTTWGDWEVESSTLSGNYDTGTDSGEGYFRTDNDGSYYTNDNASVPTCANAGCADHAFTRDGGLAVLTGTTVAQLQKANCLGRSTTIRVGQRLYVPHLPPVQAPTRTPTRRPPTATPTRWTPPPIFTNTPLPTQVI